MMLTSRKGQASFEYLLIIVAILSLVTIYTLSASRVVKVRQGVNETQELYANYSGDMLSKPNCRILFRKCGSGWGPGTSIATDYDQDGELESYEYTMDTGVVRIRLLGRTKEGYPIYYAQVPSKGGLVQSVDIGSLSGQIITLPGEETAKPGLPQQETSWVTGIAVNTNPTDPSGQYHFYEQGGSCPTDPFPLSQPGVDETCA